MCRGRPRAGGLGCGSARPSRRIPALYTVAFIPARGGSKGLPGKNLATVDGRSLVRRAVEVARAVRELDEVVVSSDDPAVLAEARAAGAEAEERAAALSRDETPSLAVIRDFLERRPEVEALVLLQPTSPLRSAADVRACLDAMVRTGSAASVTACEHPPDWQFRLDDDGRLQPLFDWESIATRRQDATPSYRLNGAVYATRAERIRAGGALVDADTHGVVMPSERSVDIDDAFDLALAELLLSRGGDAAARGSGR